MPCNIDQRGKTIRIIIGGLVEGPGLLLVVFAAIGVLEGAAPWIAGIGLVLLGWAIIAQGLLGWCAARAMGFKTPV